MADFFLSARGLDAAWSSRVSMCDSHTVPMVAMASAPHRLFQQRFNRREGSEVIATVIRLARAGAKKAPIYHLVAADRRFPRDGRFIEKLGTYNPRSEEEIVQLDADRLEHWLKSGATPSMRVSHIIKSWRKRQTAEASND